MKMRQSDQKYNGHNTLLSGAFHTDAAILRVGEKCTKLAAGDDISYRIFSHAVTYHDRHALF